VLICCDGYWRSGRVVNSKINADAAMAECNCIKKAVVVRRIGNAISMTTGRDIWWHEAVTGEGIKATCESEHMDAEDPLFILYTSGSTGKPKECCTHRPAISYMLCRLPNGFSTSKMRIPTGARQILAGLLVILM